jgi:hypothetical protein
MDTCVVTVVIAMSSKKAEEGSGSGVGHQISYFRVDSHVVLVPVHYFVSKRNRFSMGTSLALFQALYCPRENSLFPYIT